ncbi:Glycosyl hydrolase family 115 [Butyrivibrio fibrisolvens]|uniref:Glycosyl hydrolase family 115 n=1 Tax=Butyrivibrio fibrisolvens TaxID=831 RepID=A0A1H9WA22_BUTFI|nr:glycosyl hydrolase 115 family protein [Butyrivibrio fibrisolvens]SES30758.1 Glycosyl hydrolase family 115 [Butyrivibrio fibrisolvens]
MKIGYSTKIMSDSILSRSVRRAVSALERDIRNTCLRSGGGFLNIVLKKEECIPKEEYISKEECVSKEEFISKEEYIQKECFVIKALEHNKLGIYASDDLGLIYGIYHISKTFLSVGEFWFWNEQVFKKKRGYRVPDDYTYESKPYKVRFRGWFINDEVLLSEWKPIVDGSVKEDYPWEMAFEALLRCGGNMTIPGTDFNAARFRDLAGEYGLYITHHHAEPLGAEMFSRVYPKLEASFDKYPDLFIGLWEKAIAKQKKYHVIWNLGFRGQGDRPFWADDPSYDTKAKRGQLISKLIRKQYEMVRSHDAGAVCCTNLYGEIMELYKDGYIDLPDDVIRIWADNGYGKMVSRRQNNHNPRVMALPSMGDMGAHGIYYHASFYDLQAAAMMTMLPNSPEFVEDELCEVLKRGGDDFWIINCSNVKPHTYYLDLIAAFWRDGISRDQNDKKYTISNHLSAYVDRYYDSALNKMVEKAYSLWPYYSVKYGPNEDDHAGEQYANHCARILADSFIRQYHVSEEDANLQDVKECDVKECDDRDRDVKDCDDNECDAKKCDTKDHHKINPSLELKWACDRRSLNEQVYYFKEKYEDAVEGYKEYLGFCMSVEDKLKAAGDKKAAIVFDDNLICQVQYLYYSYLGALHICSSIEAVLEGTGDERFIKAFYEAGLSSNAFKKGYDTMRSHEHGIWKGFYANDCESDIRQSYYVAQSLMSYLRALGDGPHFYKWQRKYQQDAGGDKVLLILRLKSHITDDKMWELIDDQASSLF